MKVKLFQCVVSVSPGSSSGGSFEKLEAQINSFLAENPRVRPVDIKLSSHAGAVGNSVTNYGLVALMLYEDA